ncbi:MAG: FKBP-type peptidyl-prolyl cis-trans isomerase N-terminal domain-containing protein, partial [Candidatus Sulfotelmatobacter sp.]
MHKPFTTTLAILAAGVLLGNAPAQQTPPATTPPSSSAKAHTPVKRSTTRRTGTALTLKTQKEKFSYALGMRMGASLHRQDVPVDPAIFERGMKDSMAGAKTLLTDEEAQAAIMDVQNDLRKKMQEKMQVEGAANLKAGEAFLAANKTK